MKTMIRFFCMALLGVLAYQTPAIAGNDKPITVRELPARAKQVVNTHFRGKNVAVVTVERQFVGKSYDVVFASGKKLEFDRNGNWTEIDCKKSRVPAALVPSAIKNYVRKNYSGATIVQIEKARSGYEVQLSTGLELTFNKNFKVIDIDT